MSTPIVRLFTRVGCTLCDPVKFIIQKTKHRYPFTFEEVDIGRPEHAKWHDLYTNDIPVVHLNGTEIARHGLKESPFRAKLESIGCKPVN